MRANVNKIDYAGFTFAGIHTSQFGLYSVSSGDRYSRYLSPTIKNQTAENNGGAGTYFFGSQHTQQTFTFNLAFDSITETELREIKEWLNNDISPLILDEAPYIQYYVKVSSAPQINFLTFESLDNNDLGIETKDNLYVPNNNKSQSTRIYKGEMSISFIAYDPYGYSVKKWLSDYDDDNKDEWAAASGLIDKIIPNSTNEYDKPIGGIIHAYNAGTLPTDFIMTFNSVKSGIINISISSEKWMEITIPSNSSYNKLIIDTKKRLIIGDGKVCNNLLTSGDFFKLPLGYSDITIPTNLLPTIEYKYKYI